MNDTTPKVTKALVVHTIEQNWYPDRLTADCTCGDGFECVGTDESARSALFAWVREHRKTPPRHMNTMSELSCGCDMGRDHDTFEYLDHYRLRRTA